MTKRDTRRSPAREAGRLVVVDGTRGADLRKSAEWLQRELSSRSAPVGISWWDASGVFFEMGLGKRKHRVASPRTLLLLYASDLLFRLRWEIQPALAMGQTVIAAPYLDTALAVGLANGLSREWLAPLFQFAPRPSACYRSAEHKKSAGWKNGREGFGEFASAVLSYATPSFDSVGTRRQAIDLLEAEGRGQRCKRIK